MPANTVNVGKPPKKLRKWVAWIRDLQTGCENCPAPYEPGDDIADKTDAHLYNGGAITTNEFLSARLDQATKALQRVSKGVYGFCEKCNDQISAERLQVVPETTLCIKCANERDTALAKKRKR